MKRSDLLKRLYLTGVGIVLATAGIAQTHNTYTKTRCVPLTAR